VFPRLASVALLSTLMNRKKVLEVKRKCWWCRKTLRKEMVAGFLGFATTHYYCSHCHPKTKKRR